MLDARPGFIIKFLKRSLIVNFYLKHELSTWRQSAVFDNLLQSSTISLFLSKTADWQSKACVLNKNVRPENVSETLYWRILKKYTDQFHKFCINTFDILYVYRTDSQTQTHFPTVPTYLPHKVMWYAYSLMSSFCPRATTRWRRLSSCCCDKDKQVLVVFLWARLTGRNVSQELFALRT